jgi:hypothetical protein
VARDEDAFHRIAHELLWSHHVMVASALPAWECHGRAGI